MKEIIKEFKEIYKVKIVPMLKERKKLYSKRNELYLKRNELYLKINKLYSKINKLYSKRNELDSKRNELNSKINKLDSKILKIFSEFDNKHNLVIEWKNYDFKLKDISFKYYNNNNSGFIYCNIKGKTREELFKSKIETEITHNGRKYRLMEE